MRLLSALLLLAALATGEERAFVEVTAPKGSVYVGERVRVRLRIGLDREFFRTSAVPLFPQRMDLPVQVLCALPGTRVAARGKTLVLNDGVVEAAPLPDETRDGRVFSVLEIASDVVPAEPGEVTVPAPTLRYMYATRFEEDFVTGRVPKDPKDAAVRGEALAIPVLPLPEAGRPPGFEDAVGRFTVRAEADRASVEKGEILKLRLTIDGEGHASTPRVVLEGFHVYGTMDEGGSGGRTITYDIAPIDARVKEIPAIPFAFFDPGPPPRYEVVRTAPIPLEVRGGGNEEPQTPARPPERKGLPTPVLAGAALLALFALAVVLLLLRRRRNLPPEAPPDPHALRVREALQRAKAATGGADRADAFADLLAEYLRCPPAAVIGPDLASRLAARGLAPALATRVAAALEALIAARYGAGGDGVEDLGKLLAELEGSFRLPP